MQDTVVGDDLEVAFLQHHVEMQRRVGGKRVEHVHRPGLQGGRLGAISANLFMFDV